MARCSRAELAKCATASAARPRSAPRAVDGGAIAAVAMSRQPVLTAAALVLAGAVMLAVACFNIGVQLPPSAPCAGPGRSLSAFPASIAGGNRAGQLGLWTSHDLAASKPRYCFRLADGPFAAARAVAAHSAGRAPATSGLSTWLADPRCVCRLGCRAQRSAGGRIEYRVAPDHALLFPQCRCRKCSLSPPAPTAPWLVDRARHADP